VDAPIEVPLIVPPVIVTPEEEKVLAVKVDENFPVPTTSRLAVGAVDPIPFM